MPKRKKTEHSEGTQSLFELGSEVIEKDPDLLKRPVKKERVSKKTPKEPLEKLPSLKEKAVFSVSEFLDYLNIVLKDQDQISIQGEINEFKDHPTGVYMVLKDKNEEGILNCYVNPGVYRSLGITLEAGIEVRITGVPQIFKKRGQLNFRVSHVELAGEGALKKAYELLKKKLEVEGLFERKRPIPEFVEKIGIITSRTGAVIGDFRRNLAPRGFKLFLYDVRVEGAKAVPEITRAIKEMNRRLPDLDVLVVMRGGGSLEDMQAFNNELVAREVFASKIPTIAAIGHDRDVPIANLVADRETSTPSIAAMVISESWKRLEQILPVHERGLLYAFEKNTAEIRSRMENLLSLMIGYLERIFLHAGNISARLLSGLKYLALRHENMKKRVSEVSRILPLSALKLIETLRTKITTYGTYLDGVSPERNLKRGYSILMNKEGRVVKSVEDVRIGEILLSRLFEGEITSKVEEVKEKKKSEE